MSPVDLPMDVPGQRVMYAVLDSQARVIGTGTSAGTLYATESAARNRARKDGDSVIRVTINLREEPLFIRRKVMK